MKRYDWANFFIALIVFLITFVIQFLLPMSPILTWFYSIVHTLKLLYHEMVGRAIEYPVLAKFIVSFLFFLITYYGKAFIFELYFFKVLVRKHFKHSYGLVKNEMIPKMEKMVERNTITENNKMDRFIQSPIEYVNETVKGNQVPEFAADYTYQDVLFKPDIDYIVAITAENPNLWMDPTLCFYMANCYAVSLMRHANKNAITGKTKVVVRNYEDLKRKYLEERKKVLQSLSKKRKLNDFQFVRFFLYDENQRDCCKSAVLPSLKASQDLFRTLSFYILKENIQTEHYWNSFKEKVNSIWDLFGDENKSDVLKRRKEKTIPEFLVLFFSDGHIEIHTYLDGYHIKKDTNLSSDSYVGNKNLKNFKAIKDLISYMAKYEIDNGDDLKDLDEKKKNYRNTFIDWVS